MSRSQSSALTEHVQSLVQASLPACGEVLPAPVYKRLPGQPVTVPGVAATVAPESATLL